MRLLLDTHIWIWHLMDPGRLSPVVRKELADPGNELWVSPISTWEVCLLHAKRRVRTPEGVRDWITRATAHMREAPLTHEIALAAGDLDTTLKDPADRLLAGTAQVLGLTLVTADLSLLGIKNVSTLANR